MNIPKNVIFPIQGVSFHHVGLLTDNPDAAVTVLSVLGYSIDRPVTDELQDVHLQMAHAGPGTAQIEIIAPRSAKSPLMRLLRRRDDHMYHSCFCVRSVDAVKAAIMQNGLELHTIMPPTPSILFGSAMVSFYVIQGLGLIELLECSVNP